MSLHLRKDIKIQASPPSSKHSGKLEPLATYFSDDSSDFITIAQVHMEGFDEFKFIREALTKMNGYNQNFYFRKIHTK